jgi:NAD(P)H-dependent flavin oxidoreductase YrpB (nitropropane dioxygenase family)
MRLDDAQNLTHPRELIQASKSPKKYNFKIFPKIACALPQTKQESHGAIVTVAVAVECNGHRGFGRFSPLSLEIGLSF